jgi:hypothetical protein
MMANSSVSIQIAMGLLLERRFESMMDGWLGLSPRSSKRVAMLTPPSQSRWL